MSAASRAVKITRGAFFDALLQADRLSWAKGAALLLVAAIVTIAVARNLLFTNFVFGDNPLVTPASSAVIGEYIFDAWHPAAFGGDFSSPLGYVLLYAFSSIASLLKSESVFAILMNLSIPLGFLSFYVFCRKFTDGFWPAVAGAALYIVNPATISYFASGGFPWVLPFLPLAFWGLIDLLETRSLRSLAKASLFAGLTLWAFPTVVTALLAAYGAVVLSYMFLKGPGFLRKALPWLAALLLLVLAVNAPFVYGSYMYSQSPQYGYSGSGVLADFRYTYADITLPNLLRLAGNSGSPQVPLGYNDAGNVLNEIGYIIPALAIAGVLWAKFSKNRNRLLSLAASSALVVSFALVLKYVALSDLGWVIGDVPLLWTLRNPIKLQLVLAVCLAPLFAFALERMVKSLVALATAKRLKLAACAFLVIVVGVSSIGLYNPYALGGYYGADRQNGSPGALKPDSSLLSIIQDSASWSSQGTYRGIVLPFDHSAELYVQFTNPLLYPGRLGVTTSTVNLLEDGLTNGVGLANLFSLLGVKYVYVNQDWTDTGFPIVDSSNQTTISNILTADNLQEDIQGSYSKFVVDTALPHLYASTYPVFYSSLESLGLLNDSIFLNDPVLLQVTSDGMVKDASAASDAAAFQSYAWNSTPFSGTFSAYVAVYSDSQVMPLVYALDGNQAVTENISTQEGGLLYAGHFDLPAGAHSLLLASGRTSQFQGAEFQGGGSWVGSGDSLTLENGTLMSSSAYGDFDLSFNLKPLEFGEQSWNGPEVVFGDNGTSYLQLVFHKDGYLELAMSTPSGYESDLYTSPVALTPGDSYTLRVLRHGTSLAVYLNGEEVLAANAPYLDAVGTVGIGSDSSSSEYANVTISPDVVAGIWLIPADPAVQIQLQPSQNDPTSYEASLSVNNRTSLMLTLGESYDSSWTASMDGVVLTDHQMANSYSNVWFVEAEPGTHEVKVVFAPQGAYDLLLILAMGSVALMAASVVYYAAKGGAESWSTHGHSKLRQTRRLALATR